MTGMLSPLDDLPAHQIAEPARVVGTSDRNFYDRYYFNLHHCSDELFLTAGLGQYPNLGVMDGFVAVTRGTTQRVVRASRELGTDRLDTQVGPISVEVIEGLRRLRLRCDAADAGVALDVEWEGAIPAHQEARHSQSHGVRLTTDTTRFAQTGWWTGSLQVGDEAFEVTPDTWKGGRDRSWGIRAVGEPEPRGRRQAEGPGGFLWIYSTMQFDDFSIVCILQEDRVGNRVIEDATRVWREGSGKDDDPLGRFDHQLTFAPGTRSVDAATLVFTAPSGATTEVGVTPLIASHLALGTGYGMDTDWRHGMYQGPLAVQHLTFDLSDAETWARTYGLVDHLARFELDGQVGYGLFEFAALGPYDRYGFSTRSSR
jgi:hypothetical protein